MARPQDPLIEELLDVFAAYENGGTHFLDLPRALVVPGIPADRPKADFVELPVPADDQLVTDARAFLSESGAESASIPDGAAASDIQTLLRSEGVEDDFLTFRRRLSRQRIRDWLAEQGVIYT